MSIKCKPLYLIIVLLLFCKTDCDAQKVTNEDSVIYHSIRKLHQWDTENYPKSLIASNESIIVFCKIVFKKKNQIDTIIVYNTQNEEVINLITAGVSSVNFKKMKILSSFFLLPLVFKNTDDASNIALSSKLTDYTLGEMFNTHQKGKMIYGCKLFPPIYITYSNEPPKRLIQQILFTAEGNTK